MKRGELEYNIFTSSGSQSDFQMKPRNCRRGHGRSDHSEWMVRELKLTVGFSTLLVRAMRGGSRLPPSCVESMVHGCPWSGFALKELVIFAKAIVIREIHSL